MPENAPHTQPALSILAGHTRHTRFVPFEQSFSYKLFLLDIDIDRLEEASKQAACFAVERPALFSFRRRDHGARTDTPLRPWAEKMFADAGIDLDGGAIRLITLPRHLFYKFSPISLWFGYHANGKLTGIIYEVNNTFGDTHAYVGEVNSERSQQEADKQLYVSPFFDVAGKYRFTLRNPINALSLIIENLEDNTRTHMATIQAKRLPATTGAFVKAALTHPLSTHRVSLGIHYEAFKLWVKKAGYRSRPPKEGPHMSKAEPMIETTAKHDH